jgi:hypothetical protein
MGIEEKQMEMREMDRSLSAKRMELIELEKTVWRRQMLLDLTSREIEEGMLKLKEEKEKMEVEKVQREEPANCTVVMTAPEKLVAGEARIPGLQVMGVFTLFGVLAALVWGGVTSILVVTPRAWTIKPPSEAIDASTSTDEVAPSGLVRPLKPAVLSFRDERMRWEWPKRMTSVDRSTRRARAWENPRAQASWGECIRREGSVPAGLPRRMEEV